jgi:ABC-2 type transport system ATP-binding protein
MSISVQHLTKQYGEQLAVNNISFEIGKGTIVGFLGPNGAGKSTTMKMLSTYITPTSGKALVCGLDVIQNPMEVRKKVGYLPESNPLYFDMYVKEYLEFAANIHQLGKEGKQRIEEMISLTGLQKEVKKKIGTLSKGYKQRVGIAQAMIHHPEVLILDEPTSGLDPNQIMDIRNLIIELGQTQTILLSTHIMQEVEAMCRRVIIINNGTIVADDALSNIHQNQQQNHTLESLAITLDHDIEAATLLNIANIVQVQALDNHQWLVLGDSANLMRKALMQWSLQHDINIIALQENTQSLEEVFRNLTQQKTSQ